MRYLLALALPVAAGLLWATFAVPNDPSRHGTTPLPVSGLLRLGLEAAIFMAATLALADLVGMAWALAFAAVVLGHYAAYWQRLAFLLAS